MATIPKTPPPTSITVKLTQQSLNIVRQVVNALGWPDSHYAMHVGGHLLTHPEGFPKLDPIDWVKGEDEVKAMTPAARAAYLKQDVKWTTKEVTFTLTEAQAAIVKKAYDWYIAESIKARRAGPSQYLMEIEAAFKWPAPEAPEPAAPAKG